MNTASAEAEPGVLRLRLGVSPAPRPWTCPVLSDSPCEGAGGLRRVDRRPSLRRGQRLRTAPVQLSPVNRLTNSLRLRRCRRPSHPPFWRKRTPIGKITLAFADHPLATIQFSSWSSKAGGVLLLADLDNRVLTPESDDRRGEVKIEPNSGIPIAPRQRQCTSSSSPICLGPAFIATSHPRMHCCSNTAPEFVAFTPVSRSADTAGAPQKAQSHLGKLDWPVLRAGGDASRVLSGPLVRLFIADDPADFTPHRYAVPLILLGRSVLH
ncbi:hypothetical protein BDK51DRAFT_48880 [Blyttiomyces helicus]|uniref:Uncharacterized protein n=1 Tax=Blyttiomyces helicus TaxID=388810 RepID=A0A4P9VZ41_9FUNG|nr:hypothetical protein BDK51DRAFT_48880 [Blyttiomyces helicus]|eukprot:RKO84572.1 hypothetical protein BDK51DRAFT_48880 [Blyttiomyces helicus]